MSPCKIDPPCKTDSRANLTLCENSHCAILCPRANLSSCNFVHSCNFGSMQISPLVQFSPLVHFCLRAV